MPKVPGHLFSPELRQRLTDLRHAIHRHPEMALQEFRTAERLHRELIEIGLTSVDRVATTGIVARIPGTNPNFKSVAIRGDIDALPIIEETGVDFASINHGVMHACGHDIHAAWTVGAAHLLANDPACGDVVILCQPAEETAQGARAMIEAGALDGVAAVFAAHVDMRFELGEVVIQAGNVAASTDEFFIVLRGQGFHAARPHEGSDPVVGAANLVTSLQSIVSRKVPPGVPAVVTVGTIEAGTATNVVPDCARLSGTLRAADGATRDLLHSQLHQIAHGVAGAHGLVAEVEVRAGTPPVINDGEIVEWACQAIRSVLSGDALRKLPFPNLGGEDFAFYIERVPGCFLRIGGRLPDQDPTAAHTSQFLPDDGAVFVGAAVLAEVARVASDRVNRTKVQ